MRLCLVLVVTLVALVILAENTEARGRRKQRQAEEEVEPSNRENRRRGNKENKKEKKDKRGHGRHEEEDQSAHVDEMVNFDDMNPADQTTETDTPVAEPAADVHQDTAEESEEEQTTSKRGKKRRGPKENGPSMTKEERKALKHEAKSEGKRGRTMNQQDKLARKEARKEAKRAENLVHKGERQQARKEAKKMERQANKTDCSEHTDCMAGSCCQQRGPIKTCRAFNKGEDTMCFNDCVCLEGFECFIREGKKAKHPDGGAKGRCRPKQAPENTEEDQAQNAEN